MVQLCKCISPQVLLFFLINLGTSSYLSCNMQKKKMKLSNSNIKDMSYVSDNHLWRLHTQPDGTFKMGTFNNKMVLQCDKENKLVLDTFKIDGHIFWRSEGNFIVSEKSNCYLGVDYHTGHDISLHPHHCNDDAHKHKDKCALEKVVSLFSNVLCVQTLPQLIFRSINQNVIDFLPAVNLCITDFPSSNWLCYDCDQ